MPICGFARPEVETFFRTGRPPRRAGWAQAKAIATRKLDMLDYAHALEDLRAPPGNRLKALKGEWKGFYSIRINDQWRIVFRWTERGPDEVDVVDYHD